MDLPTCRIRFFKPISLHLKASEVRKHDVEREREIQSERETETEPRPFPDVEQK